MNILIQVSGENATVTLFKSMNCILEYYFKLTIIFGL